MPLADQLRPKTLDEFIGQTHLVGKNGPIRKMVETQKLSSMILWGPPGTGKTTLARIIGNSADAIFVNFSAIDGSVKDIRSIVEEAKKQNQYFRKTVLFVDEIHRFNKAQQDAFLPHVENGTITLIGATTENPGFEIIAPLISRSRIFILQKHSKEEIIDILEKASFFLPKIKIKPEAYDFIAELSNGDARSALNILENVSIFEKNITIKAIENSIQKKAIYYDKKGDNHYDTISAFIKSMRGSDPDAALHYLARMLKAGEDPMFIARRMVIFASEDIGNARPTALVLATNCMQAVHMIGMPEAQLILSQVVTYLATCPKSIASTKAISQALSDVENISLDEIPLHLRNASNKVMKNAGYGKDHVRYTWLEEKKSGKKINQQYLPENLKGKKYYQPDWN